MARRCWRPSRVDSRYNQRMLQRVDRILVRVPAVPAAVKYYRQTLGLKLIKEDKRLALLRLPEGGTEFVLHADPDLPAEAVYYLVDDVRKMFAQRAQSGMTFVQPPTPAARGFRAAIKDPFGNVMLIVDRTSANGTDDLVEDAKPPGALFAGMSDPKLPVKREVLVSAYEEVGRTADDLPYTPDFERLYTAYSSAHRDSRPTRQEVWRHLLNLRKAAKLPKLGEARSRPPEIDEEAKSRLRELLGSDIGKRDRLPYTEKFDRVVDEFNRTQKRPLSPHLVWRLVATMAK